MIKYRFDKQIIDKLVNLGLNRLPKEAIVENIELFYAQIDDETIVKIEELFKKYGVV